MQLKVYQENAIDELLAKAKRLLGSTAEYTAREIFRTLLKKLKIC